MVKPFFTIADIGCYSDSARGQYAGCLIIEMASTHGFKPYGEDLFDAFEVWQENEERFVSLYHSEWEDFLISREDYCELWEEAENYLNTMCDDTVYFGSSEGGDWGLWSVDEEECNDNLTVLAKNFRTIPEEGMPLHRWGEFELYIGDDGKVYHV